MKKLTTGIVSITLCTALMVAGIRTASSALADENPAASLETVSISSENLEKAEGHPETDGTEQIGLNADNLLSSLINPEHNNEPEGITKEETVYVIADADGSEKKVIVSDWIKNADKSDKLNDRSGLKDIVNVKGDETYEKNGDVCVWDAKGSDISYQGTSDKELPIKVKVKYTLDGQEIKPQDLKGKSGHIVIRYDYENNAKEEIETDGKKEEVTVPFLMITGLVLQDDKFTNISASNSKLINDGSRTLILGISLPGLQESLNIDRSKLEIPDHLEVEADVTDFELAMSVTVATSELFGRLNNMNVNSLEGLSESMEELSGGMNQLMNGSEVLSMGIYQLLGKSGELETGVGQLADGATKIKDGIKAANDGVATLDSGAKSLSSGVGTLKTGASKLESGIKTLAEGTDSLVSGAGQLDTGAGQLAGGLGDLKTGLDTLKENNESIMNGALQIFNNLLKAAGTQLKEAGAEIPELTADNYSEVLEGVIKTMSQGAEAMKSTSPETAAVYSAKAEAVKELKASLDSYNTFYKGLGSYTVGVAQSASGAATLKTGADNLKTGISNLKTGAESIKTGANALKTGSKELVTGIGTLKTGADSLAKGTGDLKTGTGNLLTGATSLDEGLSGLNGKIPELKKGISQLNDGALLLKNGIKEFNEKGISKITEAVEGDLEGLLVRIRAIGQAAKAYTNFSGISEDMNGQVKFIFRMEEIK